MSEQKIQESRKKIENWVFLYYLETGYANVRGAMAYSQRMLLGYVLILYGLMVGWLLLLVLIPKRDWVWFAFGAFFVISWLVSVFFKRKKDKYWAERVLSSEALRQKTEEAMEDFSSFSAAEKEELLHLVNLNRNKSVTKEAFRKELEEAMKLEGLKNWAFLQEMSREIN